MILRIQYKLSYKKVLPYLVENLTNTNTLSDSCLKILNTEKEKYTTLLPKLNDDKPIYFFNQGGVGTGERDHIKHFIIKKISMNPNLGCIFDDVNNHYTLNYSEDTFKICGTYLNQEIYYILSKKDIETQSGLLDKCLYLNDAIWHSLCILYDTSALKIEDKVLTADTLNKISESAKFILIRAYDQEGYIIWQKIR